MNFKLSSKNRTGDHIWYITNNSKFKKDYPGWEIKYNLNNIIDQIINSN